MPPQARWKGSLPDLAKAIGEKVEQPTDIDYDGNNEAKFDKVKLEAPVLQRMLRNLHALGSRLNFTETTSRGLSSALRQPPRVAPDRGCQTGLQPPRDKSGHERDRLLQESKVQGQASAVGSPASEENVDGGDKHIIDENVEREDGEIKEPPAAQDTFFYGFSKK